MIKSITIKNGRILSVKKSDLANPTPPAIAAELVAAGHGVDLDFEDREYMSQVFNELNCICSKLEYKCSIASPNSVYFCRVFDEIRCLKLSIVTLEMEQLHAQRWSEHTRQQ